MTIYQQLLAATLPTAILLGALATPAAAFRFSPIGTYESGVFDEGAAEIATYDLTNFRLFVTNANANTIDILDIANPKTPSLLGTIDIGSLGLGLGGVNSIAYNNGYIAAAVEAEDTQAPGSVLFFQTSGLAAGTFFELKKALTVGSLPDMLTFTPDGSKLLVANEGEPSSYNQPDSVDPEGSVSIIDLSGGIDGLTDADVATAGFGGFDKDELIAKGVRIFGPNATAAQDLEPEYIGVSPDAKTAFVALQENNALGILNLETNTFDDVIALGFKDHSLPGNGLDASDRDDMINIVNHPILGMYMPDAIATYEANGQTYIVTANEGDAREYDGFEEEARIKDLALNPDQFPDAEALQADEVLGRLAVTRTLGQGSDGTYDTLYAFGGRSFSIWDASGNLVWDSGDDFEQLIAEKLPDDFNANNDENGSFDSRSDAKGPEPEGVTIGMIGDRIFAFVGLERVGGIVTYDVTDPTAPTFVNYTNNRDFSGDAEAGTAGDLGPEGLLFIPANQSPTQKDLVVVTNEVSGSTTVYSVDVPEPASIMGLLGVGAAGLFGLRKRQTR